MHTPAWHVSVRVHASPSLHGVPSAAGGLAHVPVAGSHAPARWHWSTAAHATGLPPAHDPPMHVSACVQRLPSSHGTPFAAGGFVHAPVARSHTPVT